MRHSCLCVQGIQRTANLCRNVHCRGSESHRCRAATVMERLRNQRNSGLVRRRPAPELNRRQPRSFTESLHLHPAERRKHRAEPGERAETAIGPRDHPLFSDYFRITNQPLRNHLRMLHVVAVRPDHARNQNLVIRQLDRLPRFPLMLVARVRALRSGMLSAWLSSRSGRCICNPYR